MYFIHQETYPSTNYPFSQEPNLHSINIKNNTTTQFFDDKDSNYPQNETTPSLEDITHNNEL